ncbi:MAG TPA: M23 family metallopeptidase [Actinomycetes bacterium]|nr:M23 family metallopeptidase [Actinomycetes bacterium]
MPARRLAVALLLVTALGTGCSASRPAPAATAPATTGAPAGTAPPATQPPTTTAAPATAPPATRAPATTAAPAPAGYVFPVRGCAVSYGHSHHDYPATDIFTRRGCLFVAPVDGVVDEVSRTDRWDPGTDRGADRGGLAVSVVGVDGVRYYGSHLGSVAPGVAPGVRLRAGSPLGRISNTGSARGTGVHLHFGLSWPTRNGVWWVRRGMVAPWPFLDSWRRGGDLSPASAVRAARARAGTAVPACTRRC